MPNIFQIKRSISEAQPATLEFGELAYSQDSEKLFIGLSDNRVKAIAGSDYLTKITTVSFSSADIVGAGPLGSGVRLVLTETGVIAGEHAVVYVDSKGRVTSGRALATDDIPSLSADKINDFDTQVQTTRLNQMAMPDEAVSMNNQKITDLADPWGHWDAANKKYVDEGLSTKLSKDSNLSDVPSRDMARDNLGLTIGSDVQRWHTTLDYLSEISDISLNGIQNITEYGAGLMGIDSKELALFYLGLETMALQQANNVSISGGMINGVTLDGVTLDGGTF